MPLKSHPVLRATPLVLALLMPSQGYAQVPYAAETVTRAAAADPLSVSFVIANRAREKKLERAILAASNPQSPRYGHYLTLEEIDRDYRPSQRRIDQTVAYLREIGLSPAVDSSGLFVKAAMTVAEVETLTGASMERHVSAAGQSYLTPKEPPEIPKALRGLVDAIAGLDQTPLRHPRPKPIRSPNVAQLATQALSGDLNLEGYFHSGRPNTGTQAGCPGPVPIPR